MTKKKKSQEKTTIIGFVDPQDEDDDNSGLIISTEDEEYVVNMDKTGEKLLNMIDEEVQVTGRVSIAEDGTKSITVMSFENAPYGEDDEDDD